MKWRWPAFGGRPQQGEGPRVGSGSRRVLLALGGVTAALVAAELALRLAGFGLVLKRDRDNRRSGGEGAVRVLCLGESTTMNEYPPLLEQRLNAAGSGRKFVVIDKGVAGTNTGIIVSKVEGYLREHRPDVVVTMMGTNDGEWSVPLGEAAGARQRAFQMIRGMRVVKLFRLSQGRVLRVKKAAKDRIPAVARFREEKESGPAGQEADGREGARKADLEFWNKWLKDLDRPKRPEDLSPVERDLMARAEEAISHARYGEAERRLLRVMRENPGNAKASYSLGLIHTYRRDPRTAAAWFERAAALTPDKSIFIAIGISWRDAGDLDRAEAAFRKAVELGPDYDGGYAWLGYVCAARGEWRQAEKWFRRVVALNPANEIARQWVLHSRRRGVPPGSAETIRGYSAVTVENYRRLRDAVLRRNVKLVCVQYPMRELRGLEEIVGKQSNVFFVDNQKSFEEAVRREGYWALFRDKFGGTFGHCTKRGNRLLAENIGRVILDIYQTDGP